MSANSSVSEETPALAPLLTAIRQSAAGRQVDLALVLGSGWGGALSGFPCLAEYSYRDWPCFPPGAVAGHAGFLRLLEWHGQLALAFFGRWHCYQGLSAFETTLPVRLAAAAGARRILLTCAAGGIHRALRPADFMLVSDHLNLLGDNPLRGAGHAFVDLSNLYRSDFFPELAGELCEQGITLQRGVLAAMPGPTYETPAEIAMLERLGADAVTMSTVPEAIMARSLGMEVAAVSLIANLAAGRSAGAIAHADVLACGEGAATAAREVIAAVTRSWFP